MLYTLPTHNIEMQTPLCADIMSYYKKKKSPRLDLPVQQANGIDHCTRSLHAVHKALLRSAAVAKSAGGEAHSYVPRYAPQDMISLHKHH